MLKFKPSYSLHLTKCDKCFTPPSSSKVLFKHVTKFMFTNCGGIPPQVKARPDKLHTDLRRGVLNPHLPQTRLVQSFLVLQKQEKKAAVGHRCHSLLLSEAALCRDQQEFPVKCKGFYQEQWNSEVQYSESWPWDMESFAMDLKAAPGF